MVQMPGGFRRGADGGGGAVLHTFKPDPDSSCRSVAAILRSMLCTRSLTASETHREMVDLHRA